MPNKTKKSSKQKKGAKPKQKRAVKIQLGQPKVIQSSQLVAPRARMMPKKHHVMKACSILDPFCAHAKSARRPDGLGLQSIPYQVTETVTITTNTGGGYKQAFIPGYGVYYGATSSQATPPTGNYTWAANATAFTNTFAATNAQQIRIVSFGVRVMSILSSNNCQGYMIIGSTPYVQYSNVAGPGQVSYAEHTLVPLQSGAEYTWLAKPMGTAAHDFVNISSITNTVQPDWTSLVIEVSGAAVSTAVLICEVVCNIEIMLDMAHGVGSGLNLLVPPATPTNPIALQTQSAVQSSLPSIFNNAASAVSKKIETTAASVVDDFLSGAMAFLGI